MTANSEPGGNTMGKRKRWMHRQGRTVLGDTRQEMDRAEVDRLIADLTKRMHPTRELPCRGCGVLTRTSVGDVHLVENLSGGTVPLGQCEQCTANWHRLGRHAAGLLLGIDSRGRELARITVELWGERPALREGHHNQAPWQHVDADELAVRVRQARERIAARTSAVPCHYCGVVVTPVGTIWRDEPIRQGRHGKICGACWRLFQTWGSDLRQSYNGDERRGLACAEVLGLNTRAHKVPSVYLGRDLGFQFWGESGATEPNREAWGHVDRIALYRRALANFNFRGHHRWRAEQLAVLVAEAEARVEAVVL